MVVEHTHHTSPISWKNEGLFFTRTIIGGIQGRQEWNRNANGTRSASAARARQVRLREMSLVLGLRCTPFAVLVAAQFGPTNLRKVASSYEKESANYDRPSVKLLMIKLATEGTLTSSGVPEDEFAGISKNSKFVCVRTGASEVADTLGEAAVGNSVAADDTARPEVVIKVIARHGAGDFIDVLESRLYADIDYLGTGKTLLVESLRSQKPGEVLAELAEEFNRIRGDENTLV